MSHRMERMYKSTFHVRWSAIGVAWLLAAALALHHPLMGAVSNSGMWNAPHFAGTSYQQMHSASGSGHSNVSRAEAVAGTMLACPLMHAAIRALPDSQNHGSWDRPTPLDRSSLAARYCLRLPDPQARAPSAAILQIFRL